MHKKTNLSAVGLLAAPAHSVPDGFAAKRVELSGGLTAKTAADGPLLTVDYAASAGSDVT